MRLKLQPTGRQIIQDFWQPRQKEGDPVKFAEENLRVDDTGPFPNTLWDAAHSPFVIQPLQDYATDGITSTAIMKCAQSGLTECFMNAASWGICESSGSQMWVTSTEDVLRLFWEGRLKVKWERSPVMPSFSKRQKQGTLHLFFPNGILALVPSGSRAQLQSVPCRRIIMDEVRDWPPENYEIAKKRVRSHSEKAMVVTISCPEESGDHVHAAFTSGNQNRWEFLCEGCKKRIPLNFRKDEEGRGGLRWTTSKKTKPGGVWDWSEALRTVRYHCPFCDHKHKDTPTTRQWVYDSGVWVPQNTLAPPFETSYHINALLPKWVAWSSLFKEFTEAMAAARLGNMKPLKDFVCETLGEPWDPLWLYKEQVTVKKGGYKKGDLWKEATHTFMTIDVQKDHFWWVIRGWTKTGESRLIDEGLALTYDELRDIQKNYRVRDKRVGIDSNWNPKVVQRECARFGWTSLAGEKTRKEFPHRIQTKKGVVRVTRIYAPLILVDAYQGTTQQGKKRMVAHIRFADVQSKDLLELLRRNPEQNKWTVAADISKEYKSQIDGEAKVRRQLASKSFVWEWVEVSGRENHLFDCEKMQVVMAAIVGLVGEDVVRTKDGKSSRHREETDKESPPQRRKIIIRKTRK